MAATSLFPTRPGRFRLACRLKAGLGALLLLWALAAGHGGALAQTNAPPVLAQENLQKIFPGATRVGPAADQPPVSRIYRDGLHVGYAFSTWDLIQSTGFSGHRLDVVVGLDTQGRITGAWLRHHTEPILVTGISDSDLRAYTSDFRGADIREVKPGDETLPDALSGATTSSAVIANAILRAARIVAQAYGIDETPERGTARPDTVHYTPLAWDALLATGAIARKRLEWGEVAGRLREAGGPLATNGAPQDDALFIDLYTGLVTPASIGRNVLEQLDYTQLMAELGLEDSAILVAADGLYSFKGTGYVQSGRFNRIRLVQGEREIPLRRGMYRNVETIEPGKGEPPGLREIALFTVPAETGFNPVDPWRLDLLVERATAGGGTATAIFSLDYALPDRFVMQPAAAQDPGAPVAGEALWRTRWAAQSVNIALVSVLLATLTGLLLFQDFLARNRRVYFIVRMSFLAVVLVWLGWLVGAQLSVVNVLAFLTVLRQEFHWEFFLIDPLTFILWSFVAVTLLFWARGVFCGWLCPFGAFQELLNKAARRLKIPQIRVPFALHERLWPIKYVVFIALFALSLYSINLAIRGSEVEPFKTAITLHFDRYWPYAAYAGGLLFVGLFIERFFCRYLCPLGAALAIPARLRMFEWLKRRPQCGSGCNICAEQCTVQAIHPDGRINPNECIHCLHCQTLYYDDQTCPPLVARRMHRERTERWAQQKSENPQGEQS